MQRSQMNPGFRDSQWDRAQEFASIDQLDESQLAAEYEIGVSFGDPSELLEMIEEQEGWEI
jgi:hypothetical protein